MGNRECFDLVIVPSGSAPIEERIAAASRAYCMERACPDRQLPSAFGYVTTVTRPGGKFDLEVYELPDPLNPMFPGIPIGHAVYREMTELLDDPKRRFALANHLRCIGIAPARADAYYRAAFVPEDTAAVVLSMILTQPITDFSNTSVDVIANCG